MNEKNLKWDAKLYQKSSLVQYNLGMMAIERLGDKYFEDILEIGCGNGILTIELAKKYPNGRITAIELSKEMSEQAKENLSRYGIENVEVINMNAIEITFENEFDLVYSNSAIHWIRNLELMYSLLYKSLKKYGRIMIQTGLKEMMSQFVPVYSKLLRLKEYRSHFKNLSLPWRFLTKKENYKILEDTGFKNIVLEPYDYRLEFDSEENLINYHKAAGLVPFLSLIPEEYNANFLIKFKEIWFNENQQNPLEVRTMRAFLSAEK